MVLVPVLVRDLSFKSGRSLRQRFSKAPWWFRNRKYIGSTASVSQAACHYLKFFIFYSSPPWMPPMNYSSNHHLHAMGTRLGWHEPHESPPECVCEQQHLLQSLTTNPDKYPSVLRGTQLSQSSSCAIMWWGCSASSSYKCSCALEVQLLYVWLGCDVHQSHLWVAPKTFCLVASQEPPCSLLSCIPLEMCVVSSCVTWRSDTATSLAGKAPGWRGCALSAASESSALGCDCDKQPPKKQMR